MRLDFNVLWVDDQATELGATRDALTRKFASEGFQLQPTFCATIAEVRDRLSDDIFRDEIDLVLVDWELGSGDKGQNAIATIRETIQHKDIIFYSAKANTNDLRNKAYELKLDGVYFTDRNDLAFEVQGVFDSLVKKALDLDHIRGIVMGATCDVEQMVREILEVAHNKCDDEHKQKILDEMQKLLDNKLPNLQKSLEKLKNGATVESILLEHRIFTANDGARVLKNVLGFEIYKQHAQFTDHVAVYLERVVPRRNDLGHKVLGPDGRPQAFAGETPEKTVSFEEMRDLRKQLLELRDGFRALKSAL